MTDTPPPAAPPPFADDRRPVSDDSGQRAVVAALIGAVFLWLGWAFVQWLLATLTGRPFDTGATWDDGSMRQGQPVTYFELAGGAAWRDVGLFATGVALLAEAALYAVALSRPAARWGVLNGVLFVAVAGAAANAVSIAMQVNAGFTAPVYAIIGGILCVMSAMSARASRVRI